MKQGCGYLQISAVCVRVVTCLAFVNLNNCGGAITPPDGAIADDFGGRVNLDSASERADASVDRQLDTGSDLNTEGAQRPNGDEDGDFRVETGTFDDDEYAVADVGDASLASDAAPLADGVCAPRPGPPGVYDPDCVYLLGTFQEGAAGLDVLIYPPEPQRFDVGFGDYMLFAGIRPTDGRLLFSNYETAQYFVPDPYNDGIYPIGPLGNDFKMPTPACTSLLGYRAFLFPDTGTALYYCGAGQTPILYFEGSTTTFPTLGPDTIALGSQRTAILLRDGQLRIYNEREILVDPVPSFQRVAAARYVGGAFLTALVLSEEPWEIRLFSISLNGVPTDLGDYDLQIPDSSTYPSDFDPCVLDPAGSLYTFTDLLSRITRYSVSKPPIVYYDETDKPVKIHGSQLVTGP